MSQTSDDYYNATVTGSTVTPEIACNYGAEIEVTYLGEGNVHCIDGGTISSTVTGGNPAIIRTGEGNKGQTGTLGIIIDSDGTYAPVALTATLYAMSGPV